jgi:hypothetical protein
MGIFSSKSSTTADKSKMEAVTDELTSDQATRVSLQNMRLGKKSDVTVNVTSTEALRIAKEALNDAADIAGRGVDVVGDLAERNFATQAALLSEQGDLLAAGFDNVFDFAARNVSQSNALALELAAGSEGSPLAPLVLADQPEGDARAGGLMLLAIAVGVYLILGR